MGYDDDTHGGGSAVWSSALGAAMGDGMVPRTGTVKVATSAIKTGRRWPWSKRHAASGTPAA